MPRTLANAPIMILNGPNLNLLGQRQPEIYGSDTLADVEALCVKAAAAHWRHGGLPAVQPRGRTGGLDPRGPANHCGIVINPAAYSHTSVAILDALNTCDGLPVVEVHISNIHQREPFRHHSYVSQRADGVVAGCGVQGYVFGVVVHRGPGHVDFIEGLSPAVSIDQKSTSRNPRSTVGAITEVYDYLRLLFARIRQAALPRVLRPPDLAPVAGRPS
ncbi:Catabolic 3-dehydroquinase [Streptomyces violaceorubidus]